MRLPLMLVVLAAIAAPLFAAEPVKVSFKKSQLDAKFRSEGVAVADFNRDGKLDVAAGSTLGIAMEASEDLLLKSSNL